LWLGCEKDNCNGNGRSLRDDKQEEQATTKARAGWERFYIPPFAKYAMDGASDLSWLGVRKTTATETADPCG